MSCYREKQKSSEINSMFSHKVLYILAQALYLLAIYNKHSTDQHGLADLFFFCYAAIKEAQILAVKPLKELGWDEIIFYFTSNENRLCNSLRHMEEKKH